MKLILKKIYEEATEDYKKKFSKMKKMLSELEKRGVEIGKIQEKNGWIYADVAYQLGTHSFISQDNSLWTRGKYKIVIDENNNFDVYNIYNVQVARNLKGSNDIFNMLNEVKLLNFLDQFLAVGVGNDAPDEFQGG